LKIPFTHQKQNSQKNQTVSDEAKRAAL